MGAGRMPNCQLLLLGAGRRDGDGQPLLWSLSLLAGGHALDDYDYDCNRARTALAGRSWRGQSARQGVQSRRHAAGRAGIWPLASGSTPPRSSWAQLITAETESTQPAPAMPAMPAMPPMQASSQQRQSDSSNRSNRSDATTTSRYLRSKGRTGAGRVSRGPGGTLAAPLLPTRIDADEDVAVSSSGCHGVASARWRDAKGRPRVVELYGRLQARATGPTSSTRAAHRARQDGAETAQRRARAEWRNGGWCARDCSWCARRENSPRDRKNTRTV